MSPETVRVQMKTKVGKPLSSKELNADIKRLVEELHLFSSVTERRLPRGDDGVKVTLYVTDKVDIAGTINCFDPDPEKFAIYLTGSEAKFKDDMVFNGVLYAPGALVDISAIKVIAPNVLQSVVDAAIQIHGGEGMSDLELTRLLAMARALRIADGPDEVHRGMVARLELKKYV